MNTSNLNEINPAIDIQPVRAVYVPHWLFTGCWVDIFEWDGTKHSVKVTLERKRREIGGTFQTWIGIEYCDGVNHIVSLELFLGEMGARIHEFSWVHYYSGGGSKVMDNHFWHVAGCDCAIKQEEEKKKRYMH